MGSEQKETSDAVRYMRHEDCCSSRKEMIELANSLKVGDIVVLKFFGSFGFAEVSSVNQKTVLLIPLASDEEGISANISGKDIKRYPGKQLPGELKIVKKTGVVLGFKDLPVGIRNYSHDSHGKPLDGMKIGYGYSLLSRKSPTLACRWTGAPVVYYESNI